MESQDLRDRIARSQTGDRGAFADLIRDHARLVWATVYGVIRDPAWTEDLVQETFMKAWQNIRELRDPEHFPGWLATIARRLTWEKAEVLGRVVELTSLLLDVTKPQQCGCTVPERNSSTCRNKRSAGIEGRVVPVRDD